MTNEQDAEDVLLSYKQGVKVGRAEALAEVRNKIKKLRKKSDRCSDCDGCNCDLCMLEFVKLKQLESKDD
jgi:hypothetical protein